VIRRKPGSESRHWETVHPARTRRLWVGCGIALLLAVTGGATLWTAPEWLIDWIATHHPGCVYQVPTSRPMVALTIDDGPDPVATPLILAELRRENARATFFLIAGRTAGREQVVRELVTQGHEIGNHFSDDRRSISLSAAEFEADLLRAHRVLQGFGPVTWARPGSGWYSQAMIGTMRRHGYRCALGSVYPFDAAIPSVSFATRYILSHARPGAVLVLHDGGKRGLRTTRVLRNVLPELRRRGYRVVTLTELAGR
jgi:peptidoglycan/xylan/chitin deacetylase (PgdA/CDA1 family)